MRKVICFLCKVSALNNNSNLGSRLTIKGSIFPTLPGYSELTELGIATSEARVIHANCVGDLSHLCVGAPALVQGNVVKPKYKYQVPIPESLIIEYNTFLGHSCRCQKPTQFLIPSDMVQKSF